MALQKVLDILRNARNKRTVLTDTLSQGKEKVCGVIMLVKEIDFINEDIGLSAPRLVCGNSIEDTHLPASILVACRFRTRKAD